MGERGRIGGGPEPSWDPGPGADRLFSGPNKNQFSGAPFLPGSSAVSRSTQPGTVPRLVRSVRGALD
ncbi:hypothetical protein GCM10009527_008760 [Actinomadura nitritigenes]